MKINIENLLTPKNLSVYIEFTSVDLWVEVYDEQTNSLICDYEHEITEEYSIGDSEVEFIRILDLTLSLYEVISSKCYALHKGLTDITGHKNYISPNPDIEECFHMTIRYSKIRRYKNN